MSNVALPHEPDRSSAVSRLVRLYESRKDLQTKYPEAAFGDLENLIGWAADTVLKSRKDRDARTLNAYAAWYVHSASKQELEARTTELESARGQLEATHARILYLEDLKSKLENNLEARTTELRELADEREVIANRLHYTQAELDDIKASFGFWLTRFYGSRLDRFLPGGTRRGEIKRIVANGARIIVKDGLRRFFSVAWQKARIGNLAVQREPSPELPSGVVARDSVRPSTVETGPQISAVTPKPVIFPEPSTVETGPQILMKCDRPPLSGEPSGVSSCFVVEGWVIAQEGVSEVKVFLDGKSLGSASMGLSRPDVARAFPTFPNAERSGFMKLVTVEGGAERTRHSLKIVAEGQNHALATIEGRVVVEHSPVEAIRTADHADKDAQLEVARGKPSVVVLTENPPADFEHTLQRLRDQQGIEEAEIIIVNSGEEDLSHLSGKYQARILRIRPEEFEHGATRNFGAQESTGDYVFFITDDAIPASRYLLRDMIRCLNGDETIAGVTARQIPRSDADLMACQAIWWHYRMLELRKDRVVWSANLDNLIPRLKRGICQVDDVCSGFRRDLLLEHKFAIGQRYAEDLELGMRLVRRNLKIGQLFSVGVIHSHNRSPSYYVKRTYVDIKTLSRLLRTEKEELDQGSASSLGTLLDAIQDVCDRVCVAIDHLRASEFCGGDVDGTFETIREHLKDGIVPATGLKLPSQDLSSALKEVFSIVAHTPTQRKGHNPLCVQFQASVDVFRSWLTETHEGLEGIEEPLIESLVKLLGAEIGRWLAHHYLYCRRSRRLTATMKKLDRFLSEDV